MTHEERARIARENGAKSRGPKTEEGKAKSSRNAIKDGAHATKLSLFVPPNEAVSCKEDRHAYYALLDGLLEVYQPLNQVAAGIVKEIATARWQVERLNHCLTAEWDLAFIHGATTPATVVPGLAELEILVNASRSLYAGDAIALKINRQIDQLELRIGRLERRLPFVHKNFSLTENRMQPIENTETPTENEPSVSVTENTTAAAASRQNYGAAQAIYVSALHSVDGIETTTRFASNSSSLAPS